MWKIPMKLLWILASGLGCYIVKRLFYLQLCWPFCSAEHNGLYKFGRWHYEEQLSAIILKIVSEHDLNLRFRVCN